MLGPDNVVQPRVVTTRQTVGDKWLITGGLRPGDKVIVEGLVGVMPGMKVTSHPAGAKPPKGAPAGPPQGAR